jgi:hypothetical protein
MKSYDPKEWDRLVSTYEPNKKKVRRARIESKVLNTNKKIKKVSLKELFSRGKNYLIQMIIMKRSE